MHLSTSKMNFTHRFFIYLVRNKALWEKQKMLVTGNFLLFPQCFQKLHFKKSLTSDCEAKDENHRSNIW